MGRGSSKRKAPVVEVKEEVPQVVEVESKDPEVVEVQEVSIQEPVAVQVEEPIVVNDVKEAVIEAPAPIYSVRVTHPSLRRRIAPTLRADVLGLITDKGIYGVFEERDGWGRLEDKSWIKLEFTEKV